MYGLRLSEDDALKRLFERAQPLAIRRRRLARRNTSHSRDDRLDVGDINGHGVGRGFRHVPIENPSRPLLQPRHRAGFIDQIDGTVRQAVVAQVASGELGCGVERRFGVLHAMMLFVPAR
jgi:hypothetical protein